MPFEIEYTPPRVRRAPLATPLPFAEPQPIIDAVAVRAEAARGPFVGYVRHLTAQGGILIAYKDIDRSVGCTILRVFAWCASNLAFTWVIVCQTNLNLLYGSSLFLLLAFLSLLIVRMKFEVHHTVEIRPEAMIVDGTDMFLAKDIGDNWPALEMLDEEDPDRMVISGVCGTRFIEYMTANRADRNDSTPEVLAADLQEAMEQLWGRRELVFPATP
jgi:hypothetical protein